MSITIGNPISSATPKQKAIAFACTWRVEHGSFPSPFLVERFVTPKFDETSCDGRLILEKAKVLYDVIEGGGISETLSYERDPQGWVVFMGRLSDLAVRMFPTELQLRHFAIEKVAREQERIKAEQEATEIRREREIRLTVAILWIPHVLPWVLCALVLWATWDSSLWVSFLWLLLAWNIGRFGLPLLLILLKKIAL